MAVTFTKGAAIFIGEAVTFVGNRGLVIGRLFKAARVRVGAVKGVNKCNLRWRLITYELKCSLLLIYSLISISDYSIGLSL